MANGQVEWHGAEFSGFVTKALQAALTTGATYGESMWDMIAPVGIDPRTSGDLKRSWFGHVTNVGGSLSLVIGASARHAIYVELGTSTMSPRAPVRTTAAEIVAILPYFIANELKT
jgi:hypothetical protein